MVDDDSIWLKSEPRSPQAVKTAQQAVEPQNNIGQAYLASVCRNNRTNYGVPLDNKCWCSTGFILPVLQK